MNTQSAYPLTKSERTILEAIGWGEQTKQFHELREASGLTITGFRRVLHSMEDRCLIGRADRGGFYTTFKGARAAKLAEPA